jgi:maleate isomerase
MLSIRTEVVDVQFVYEDVPLGGTVGLLAMSSDANIENDLHRLLPRGVGLYTTRVPNTEPITIETLATTAGRVTGAARMILPGREVDILVYGSTPGALVLGSCEVDRLLRAAKPRAGVLTPAAAAEAALRHLGVRNLSLLTPYVRPVNQLIADHFERAGFEITHVSGFGLKRDADMTRLPSWALVQAARQTCASAADALFVAGSSIRSTEVIEDIEAIIGRPVVTSNQALAWRLADLLGVRLPENGLGQLVHSQYAQFR